MEWQETLGTCRRITAKYAATREKTMQRNIALADGEAVLVQAMVFQKKSWWQRVPGLLWLTRQRMFLLEHYAFRKDVILEIPRHCVRNIGCEPDNPNSRVIVEYVEGDKCSSLNLHTSFPRLGDSGDELAKLLRQFQNGTLSAS